MGPSVGFIDKLNEVSTAALSFAESIQMMGHSALLGLGLMLLTAWASNHSVVRSMKSDDQSSPNEAKSDQSNFSEAKQLPTAIPSSASNPAEIIFSAANVLYLCFGMTAMMLIVNNNIARAFAIAAAIAIVRFRIKVNAKLLSMSLFYGVLTGMACGVGQVVVAYILVFFFGFLQTLVLAAAKIAAKNLHTEVKSTQLTGINVVNVVSEQN